MVFAHKIEQNMDTGGYAASKVSGSWEQRGEDKREVKGG